MSVPANGSSFVALLVGGNDDILRNLRSELFDEFGIELRSHWDHARQFCAVPPRDTEAILILTDFCSHGMSREAVKIAKANKIRFALIGRKKSAWLNGLNLSGFIHKPSWLKPTPPQPRPVDVRKEEKMDTTKLILTTNGVAKNAPPVTLPTERSLPRYVETPRKWTEGDMQTIVRLAEAWIPVAPPASYEDDGNRFVIDVWHALGTFRTPSVLRLRLDALRTIIRVPPGLLIALSRGSKTMHDLKVAYMRDEKARLKGGRETWPEWISVESAQELVGVKYRLSALRPVVDSVLGLYVFRRSELLSVLTALETRGVTPDFRGWGRTPLEWEQHILETLKTRGPSTRGHFGIQSSKANPRGAQSLDALVSSGAIAMSAHRGQKWYRLPDHPWPPVPRPLPPQFAEFRAERAKAKAVVEVKPVAPAPSTPDTLRELRADVYRAMRAGEITAKDAAELLRNLANGG